MNQSSYVRVSQKSIIRDDDRKRISHSQFSDLKLTKDDFLFYQAYVHGLEKKYDDLKNERLAEDKQ